MANPHLAKGYNFFSYAALFSFALLLGAQGTYAGHANRLRHRRPQPIPFSPGFDIDAVLSLAISLPSHSWEFGTASEALLELYDPKYSVFGSSPFPLPSPGTLSADNSKSLAYAKSKIVFGTGANGLSDGDGAVGDPASLGVSAVLLGTGDPQYMAGAVEEIEYLLCGAPRWPNGAISHRAAVAELWADFIYMAPPFMAFYGAATNNASVLQEAVVQCGLYRQVLKLNTTEFAGLWHHIDGPQTNDPGLWSTGNAWAAAGMTRVLGTVIKAPDCLFQESYEPGSAAPALTGPALDRSEAISDLSYWIKEILDAAMYTPTDHGMLGNYLNDTTNADGHGYGELSGTTLLASVAYRVAVLCPEVFGEQYVSWAEGARKLLGAERGTLHVTKNGTVVPTVNPLNWGDTQPWTAGSPEGQNFVVLMYAAWRDCVKAGVCRYPI